MDVLDAAIIRELFYPGPHQWNVRESYATVARGVGVDEETVRLRLKRLEADGVLQGWDLMVNPSVLQRILHQVIVDVDQVADREAIVERLKHIEGVYWIFQSYGGGLGIVAYVEPGAAVERFAQLVTALTGGRARHAPFFIPPATVEPDETDWRIVQALRPDVRLPFATVAERLGLSEKTVRRRMQRLVEGRVVFLNGRVGFARMRGLIPVQAKVWLHDGAGKAEVEKVMLAIPNRTFFNLASEVPQLSFLAESMGDVEAARAALASLPHVEAARVEVLLQRVVVPDWLEERIARGASAGAVQTEQRLG